MERSVRVKLGVGLLSAFLVVPISSGAALNTHPKRPQNMPQRHATLKVSPNGYNVVEIMIPDAVNITPFEVNNAGIVSGTYTDALSFQLYTFVWYNGTFIKIARVENGAEVEQTNVASITDSGILFGNWGGSNAQRVGCYDLNTDTWTPLPPYPDQERPLQYGQRMNNAGVAVGGACRPGWTDCVGWIWDGRYHSVIVPSFSTGAQMAGINERQEVAVMSDSEPVVTPFNPLRAYWLYRGDLSLVVLPETPTSLGTEYAGIYDINNRSEAVMMAPLDDPAGFYVPTLYDHRHNTVTRLPTAPLPNCNELGGSWYTGMNDQGSLVGQCFYISDDYSNFVPHAFVAYKK